MFFHWLLPTKRSVTRRSNEPLRRFRPALEALEDRLTPTSFHVNSAADTVAANLATGKDSAGNITLRSAIMAANSVSNAGDDIIVLPVGTYTRTLAGSDEFGGATGDFNILASGKLTITGAGPRSNTIIDAAGLDRVFNVNQNASLELVGVTVRGGNPGSGFGGGIANSGTTTINICTFSANSAQIGGGIFSTRELTVSDCTFAGNSANSGGGIYSSVTGSGPGTTTVSDSIFADNSANYGGGFVNQGIATISGSSLTGNSASLFGGGIYNTGTLTVNSSTLAGNSASDSGGGIYNYSSGTLTANSITLSGNQSDASGGAINNLGTLTVSGSSLSGNSVNNGSGGGIFNTGTLTVSGSSLSGNSVNNGSGGGIRNNNMATLSDSTLSGNSVNNGSGGGIFNFGSLTVTGSTLSANFAQNAGGGIYIDIGSNLTVSRSTLFGNSAQFGGGIDNFGDAAPPTLRNTILAGNTAGDGPNVQNSVVSIGNNLVDDPAGSSGWLGSDLLNVDAQLGPLAHNGGLTLTHALLAGSPAIDAGNNTGAPLFDQRGVLRMLDGADADTTRTTDIGAFEAQTWMAHILNQATNKNTALAISFATSPGIVNVTATSDNPMLVRAVNIRVTGAGPTRTLTITPVANQQGTAVITVTVSDGTSSMTDTFMLTVHAVNGAPVLDSSGAMTLQAINEDDVSSFGTRVSDIILSAAGDRITDTDAGAVEGIAVANADNTNGIWQFSTDSAATWTSLGAPSAVNARLLAAGAFVRFVPHADFNGASSIAFRAWDQTSGVSGGTADVSTNGGDTAYSTATETALIKVLAVNDAPGAVDDSITIDEDSGTNAVNVLTNDSAAPDSGETLGIVRVTQGTRGSVAITGGGTGVAYTPSPDFAGIDSFTYTVADGNGGLAVATVAITVNDVNDAPRNTVPMAQKTTIDKILIFSGARRISIADIDAGSLLVRVTLTVSHGAVSLGTIAGVSVTGNGTAKVIVTGTVEAINNALNALKFKPARSFRGKAMLAIFTEDLGNFGFGGPKTALGAVAISVV